MATKTYLQLALAHEGGGAARMASQRRKNSPLARSCTRGRWRLREWDQNTQSSTSGSLLYAREVEAAPMACYRRRHRWQHRRWFPSS